MTSIGTTCGRAWTNGGLLAATLLVMTTAVVWGSDTELARETLRGITGVMVVVENVSPDIERAGLTPRQLQTDAELRLRKAGIRVLTREERLDTPGGPYLYIRVTGFRVHSMTGALLGYAAFSHVSLHQNVWLTRDPTIMAYAAETWRGGGFLDTFDGSNVRPIRESVTDQVDAFINAYLAVNPERSPAYVPRPEPAPAPRKEKRR
jgi:hypothetical protein